VVIGGGVAAFGDLLLAPLTKECMHYGRNAFARRLKVRLASLSGPEAGLIGAAALAATSGNQYSVSGLM
jgi:predicted NBD/HSP70 family sugar kinase